MRKISAVFKKQILDTLKNKTVLIQFIMMPLIATIMEKSVKIPDMPSNYFVILFASMFIGMAPMTSTASIISEEKENNTLRVLMMSNVKAWEYLLGVGLYILICCSVGAIVFATVGQYKGKEFVCFIGIMMLGIIISELIGAAIGMWSKNQMSATAITVPVMMLFSFLPMLSVFNEKIAAISQFTFSQKINDWISQIGIYTINGKDIWIIALNMLVAGALFVGAYYHQEE